jgi:hypothetical protein
MPLDRRVRDDRLQPVRRHRLGLALHHERRQLHNLDRRSYESERLLSDQHLSRRGRLLEPRRDVDRIARREPFRRPGHDLPAVHADPALHAERGNRIADLDRRTAGAKRIVLVQDRYPEDGHHRVADELLHRAAVALDDRADRVEVPREQRP